MELVEGQEVMIYEDPYTQKRKEGIGTVTGNIEVVDETENEVCYRCDVHFPGDKYDATYSRQVVVAKL